MFYPRGRKRHFERSLRNFFKRRRVRSWQLESLGIKVKSSRSSRRPSPMPVVLLGSAAAALMLFAFFRPIFNPFSPRSATSPSQPGFATLYETMPSGYASLRKGPLVGSCETLAFETSKQGQYRIHGFGIINSIKGETPIWVYVEIVKGDRKFYATAESMERPDIVKSFNNPLLLYSGFRLLLPEGALAPPFEVKTFLVFDNTSFPCMYTARVS